MTIEFIFAPDTEAPSTITAAEEEAILALVIARRRNDTVRHLAALEALGRVARHCAVRTMLLLDVARVVQAATEPRLVDTLPPYPC